MDKPNGAMSIKIAAIVGALAGSWLALFPYGNGTPVGRLVVFLYGYWPIAFWVAFLVAAMAVLVTAYAIFPGGH